MPKFSIIIPVYNVEKYLKKCLESIKNQSYKDYEVIIVNDGSTDKSKDILDEYDYKVINQKNQGLSVARNNGVKKATGEYLIFVDSDDYIEKDLLKEINKSLTNNPDIVRYQVKEVYEDDDKVIKYEEESFKGLSGDEAFKIICRFHFVENAWSYAYKTSFYKDNNFSFKEGSIHEDFGLIPLVIMKSKVVNSISYVGYNYLQRKNSIMSSNNYEKTIKKVSDFYNHYKYLISEIDKTNLDSSIYKSFCANSLLLKICDLKGNNYLEYKRRIKKEKITDNLLSNTLPRKIKKCMFKISPKLTAKLIK